MASPAEVSGIEEEPLVVGKQRTRLGGESSHVWYACGRTRRSQREASDDARYLDRKPLVERALQLILEGDGGEGSTIGPELLAAARRAMGHIIEGGAA